LQYLQAEAARPCIARIGTCLLQWQHTDPAQPMFKHRSVLLQFFDRDAVSASPVSDADVSVTLRTLLSLRGDNDVSIIKPFESLSLNENARSDIAVTGHELREMDPLSTMRRAGECHAREGLVS
jgi:hypothetical protein